ncbi:MAG: hypothetical protein KBB37_01475 [Bacteroidia bacterium]|nr:hypothetical protein [Bacteroidia bacterium]MBP9179442.1 hypothetical protein [Bacteroidia bacterium]MBP9723721.1 hypothetical protein [Bacteroidia bacterium]
MEKINSYELSIGNCLRIVDRIFNSKSTDKNFLQDSRYLLFQILYRKGLFEVFNPEYFEKKYDFSFDPDYSPEDINRKLIRFGYYNFLDQVVCFSDHKDFKIEPFGYFKKVSKEEQQVIIDEGGIPLPLTEWPIYDSYFYFLICLLSLHSNRETNKILNYHENKFVTNLKPKFREELRLVLRDQEFSGLIDTAKTLTINEWIEYKVNEPFSISTKDEVKIHFKYNLNHYSMLVWIRKEAKQYLDIREPELSYSEECSKIIDLYGLKIKPNSFQRSYRITDGQMCDIFIKGKRLTSFKKMIENLEYTKQLLMKFHPLDKFSMDKTNEYIGKLKGKGN